MENQTLSRPTVSFGLALALASVADALLVVAKEKSIAVQSVMKNLTGHHWITHAAIVIVLFGLFGWIFCKFNFRLGRSLSARRFTKTITAGVVAAILIIVAFYLIAD